MTSERKPILQKLCKFIRYINMIVCPANSICRFIVLVYIVYSLICSFLCNLSVYMLCTVNLRNKDIDKRLKWFVKQHQVHKTK
jgi:Na+-transporting NADH:ubiquinone oxidoreductase subunit NqrC